MVSLRGQHLNGICGSPKRPLEAWSPLSGLCAGDLCRKAEWCMEQHESLELVRELCGELDRVGVSYCHWKSNDRLGRSASGENDLDLLVGRADVRAFNNILCRLGFRQAQEPPDQQLPGVLHYYGLDRSTDRLVHIHVHHQLIVGHDATKNYRLPIEAPYLRSAVQDGLFRVPAPEFELAVFVVRMVLKHSTWDAILARQGALSTAEQQELVYLRSRVSQSRMHDVLRQQLPYVRVGVFDDCVRSLEPDCPFWARVRAGQRLQSSLRGEARRPQMPDTFLKLWRRVVGVLRWRVLGGVTRKRMTSGGLIVAIVGGDGAGKTTAVDGLYAWLSKDFWVVKVHMGKPAWSLATIAVRGILKVGRSIGLYPYVRTPIGSGPDTEPPEFPGYPWLLREACTARDRCLTYARARRLAANGAVVICDRFPLPQLKLMDGPQVERWAQTGQGDWLVRFLAKQEKRYYESITMPELVVVLRVDPEIAVQRKGDENAASVRARSTEVWDLGWQQTRAHVLDASRPRSDVLSELRALVWSYL